MRELLSDHMSVRANCPECKGATTTFEARSQLHIERNPPIAQGRRYEAVRYYLLRCAGCGRGGLAGVGVSRTLGSAAYDLIDFSPRSMANAALPKDLPMDLTNEFREAELTASVGAWRAASALMRSTLEKALKHSGYSKGNLKTIIDEAANDGAITAARSLRAHDDIRVLGNDILHDDWRPITEAEFEVAHRYTQRILEDLYDDRPSVLRLLTNRGRKPSDLAQITTSPAV